MEEIVTIYVDIVLLENLCMNYIILFGTAYIIKIKVRHLRILLASLIGAIYAVLAYAGIFPIYANLITKIILSICMTYIAFNPKKLKGLIKELIVFYLVSFALGGCAFALLYIVRPQDIFMRNGVYIGTYPIKIECISKNGICEISIYGIEEEVEYEVEIQDEITEVIPYTTKYIENDELEEGVENEIQKGVNGYKSEAYKILKLNGQVVSKTLLSKDSYNPLERIVEKGTKK